MGIVGRILRQAGNDTLHMKVDKIVDGSHLVLTVLMRVGTNHRVTRFPGFNLNTIEHGRIIVSHHIRHYHANNPWSLFSKTLCKGVGAIVKAFSQSFHLFLHLLTDLRRTA